MKRLFAFVVAAAALVGCQQAKVAVTGCKPPNYAPIYAGAGATKCQETETADNGKGTDKGTAQFTIPDAPSVVVAFYKTGAERAGLATSGIATATDGTIMLSAADSTPAHRRLNVDIKPSGSGSMVVLSWENAARQKNP